MNQLSDGTPKGFCAIEEGIERITRKLKSSTHSREDVVLMRLVTSMARHYEELVNRTIRPQHLNAVMFKTLLMAFGSPTNELNPSRLSEVTGESRANMTRICDELCQRGLIERHAGQTDRRRIAISLTATGERMVQKMLPLIGEPLQRVHARFSAAEKRQLEMLLKRQLAGLETVLGKDVS
ncbi:MAG: MarR family transcriptional regulator [Rudaea sp.]|nr:MarR family transcriptional regulator [Rudaea sp.]